ncbi:hypothetical protein [Mucilaginibacter sp.]|jgi:hypothetical protein|uniref:hypothetical protein n=1 Tax=Mucilaginibacter sp. TaxID=1882438 RepID=UPI0035645B9F
MKRVIISGFIAGLLVFMATISHAQQKRLLSLDKLKASVDYFNSIDTETVKNFIPNEQAYNWLAKNIPLFECPDSALQKIYYYRWWIFCGPVGRPALGRTKIG